MIKNLKKQLNSDEKTAGYCKTSSLPSVTSGTWSPATKVDYKGYATLTCASGTFVKGDSVASCGNNGAFMNTTSECIC